MMCTGSMVTGEKIVTLCPLVHIKRNVGQEHTAVPPSRRRLLRGPWPRLLTMIRSALHRHGPIAVGPILDADAVLFRSWAAEMEPLGSKDAPTFYDELPAEEKAL